MTGLEALNSVQYMTANGQRFAVLDMEAWETLVEWLETIEDVQIAKQAYESLKEANGDREKAGWLKWDDVKQDIE